MVVSIWSLRQFTMLNENVPASLVIADIRWPGEPAKDLDSVRRQERALRGAMSALHPKADIRSHKWNVR
jgi:hypothetical protein